MRKRYCLSAAGSVLILVVMLSSIAPAMASYPSSVTLEVTSIASDDQTRRTGIIVLGLSKPGGWTLPYQPGSDFTAHYTFAVRLTGVPTNPTYVIVQVVMMNRVVPLTKQDSWENLKTVPVDKTANFVAKARWLCPGVGFLDVYYIGSVTKEQIGDYMLVITAGCKVGKVTIWGTTLQKICVLGFSMGSTYWSIFSYGTFYYTWDDPVGPFSSCEEAAWAQRRALGVPMLTG